jgi:hypothetical protein
MPILNYTTKVDAPVTIAEITLKLVKHGARKILQEYEPDGRIHAISFTVMTPAGERGIRMPAKAEAVLKVLTRQKVKADINQAERVAWRDIKDWVEAQLALLETEMVSMEEAFFPYLLDDSGEKTLFDAYREKQALLTGGEG